MLIKNFVVKKNKIIIKSAEIYTFTLYLYLILTLTLFGIKVVIFRKRTRKIRTIFFQCEKIYRCNRSNMNAAEYYISLYLILTLAYMRDKSYYFSQKNEKNTNNLFLM